MSTLGRAKLAAPPVRVLRDRVVQPLVEAEGAVAVAVRVQANLVMDAAAAQEVFARRQKLGADVIGSGCTIKTRVLTRLGELLQQLDKAKGPRRTWIEVGRESHVGVSVKVKRQ